MDTVRETLSDVESTPLPEEEKKKYMKLLISMAFKMGKITKDEVSQLVDEVF